MERKISSSTKTNPRIAYVQPSTTHLIFFAFHSSKFVSTHLLSFSLGWQIFGQVYYLKKIEPTVGRILYTAIVSSIFTPGVAFMKGNIMGRNILYKFTRHPYNIHLKLIRKLKLLFFCHQLISTFLQMPFPFLLFEMTSFNILT